MICRDEAPGRPGAPGRGRGARRAGARSLAMGLVLPLVLLSGCGSPTRPRRRPREPSTEVKPPQRARRPAPVAAPAASKETLARGQALYARQCASCHGATGRGDGEAAYLLYPKPRDFTLGAFRLTSAKSGLPPEEDLLRTLERGMPGSAMPPWGHLPRADLAALARVVRHLAVQGKAADLAADDSSIAPAEAQEIAAELLATSDRVSLSPAPTEDEGQLARGKDLYERGCASCHGVDGTGDVPQRLRDGSGVPVRARDFTRGVFKGGSSTAAIAMRIKAGIPGSPMPASDYPDEDIWAIARYVKTLILPGAQERIEQRRLRLSARPSPGPLPATPRDPAWTEASETYVPVWPLWWRDDRVEGLRVAALHDGARVALRLSWDDDEGDDRVSGQRLFTDGVAVQLASGKDPPFFAMGAVGEPVTIWHWKAAWEADRAGGFATASSRLPNMPAGQDGYPGHPGERAFLTASAARNPLAERRRVSAAEASTTRGFGTLTPRFPFAQNVKAAGARTESGWAVVFTRALQGAGDPDVALSPGAPVSIGFAVWDGGKRDRNGQKSVTIWHELTLEEGQGGAE